MLLLRKFWFGNSRRLPVKPEQRVCFTLAKRAFVEVEHLAAVAAAQTQQDAFTMSSTTV